MFRIGMRVPLTGPWALLIGVICIGVATYLFLASNSLLSHGVATEAKVVGVDSRWESDGRTHALVLEFTDQGGAWHRERTGYDRHHRWTRTGERVRIRYNPQRPAEFAIDSWYGLWMMPATFLVAGLIGCAGFLVGPSRRDWAAAPRRDGGRHDATLRP